MTCQWCIRFRRRGGRAACLRQDETGATVYETPQGADGCGMFQPRRNCSTCEYRCPADEKERLLSRPGGCGRWELRRLTTWGGCRRFSSAKKKEAAK